MATTPNVGAAETSAPNASVTSTQPVQTLGSTMTAVPVVGSPMAPVTTATVVGSPMAPVPGAKPVAAGTDRKAEIADEQAQLRKVANAAAGKDHFEQQEIFGKMFEEREGEDSFRRAVRIERERESLMSAGDPTRDPVAKQKAMDANFVLPGAQADAAKIKKIGTDEVAKAAADTK